MQHCAGFISVVTLHVSGVKRPSSGVLKTDKAAPGTGVIVAGRSSHHHIRDEWWCDDLRATITPVPGAAVPVFNTPDDGRLTPETCSDSAEIKPA